MVFSFEGFHISVYFGPLRSLSLFLSYSFSVCLFPSGGSMMRGGSVIDVMSMKPFDESFLYSVFLKRNLLFTLFSVCPHARFLSMQR